ncbi:Alpha/Beta hydrolase protein [Xylariales sp. PMI_506]|nr:Alpha/Beta hydrolase protein [Xylariales sp. PMI_506]
MLVRRCKLGFRSTGASPFVLPKLGFTKNYEGCQRFISQLRDVRQTKYFQHVESHFRSAYTPAFGKPSQASQPSVCPTAPLVAVKAGVRDSLEKNSSRISIINTATGHQTAIRESSGSHDSSPQWSPNGQQLAFLSDRLNPGVLGVFILDNAYLHDPDATPQATPPLPGTVEAFSWSPDGSLLLIRVAEHGADQAGAYGSGRMGSFNGSEDEPSWLPNVSTGEQESGWRSIWLYDPGSSQLKRVGKPGLNVWEAVWLGQNHLFAVVSSSPAEDAWYEASLAILDVQTGNHRTVYREKQQLGLPAATPSGQLAAFVECLSSDRGGVAGQVVLFRRDQSSFQRLDLNNVDVTYLQWVDEECLAYMGLRGAHTVAGHYYPSTGQVKEHWVSEQTSGPLYPEGAVTRDGRFVIVSESWSQYQQLDIAYNGQCQKVLSWAHEGSRWLQSQVGSMQSVTWNAPDGLEIQGYLALPASHHRPPYPLILNSHGGPVWTFRNTWSLSSPLISLLVSHGYAVLSANPRGSTGKGAEFTAKVLGDMGGMDAKDLLSGVNAMVDRKIANPHQLGVMGVSYGGYMAAWLPTISPCFRAAVPIAPIINWSSYHNTSNIGKFDELFFQEDPHKPDNLYHHRSPVMFAGRYPTPIMQVVGEQDRCVHPSQSLEYHHVLRAKGINSTLLVYPDEGHGIRSFPAYIDFSARVLNWFDEHLLEGGRALND